MGQGSSWGCGSSSSSSSSNNSSTNSSSSSIANGAQQPPMCRCRGVAASLHHIAQHHNQTKSMTVQIHSTHQGSCACPQRQQRAWLRGMPLITNYFSLITTAGVCDACCASSSRHLRDHHAAGKSVTFTPAAAAAAAVALFAAILCRSLCARHWCSRAQSALCTTYQVRCKTHAFERHPQLCTQQQQQQQHMEMQ
jgi:hypothetical protein